MKAYFNTRGNFLLYTFPCAGMYKNAPKMADVIVTSPRLQFAYWVAQTLGKFLQT